MQHLLNKTHALYVITEAFASLLFETREYSHKEVSVTIWPQSCHLSLLFQLPKQHSCCSLLISGDLGEGSVTVCSVLRTCSSIIISPTWLILGCCCSYRVASL